MAIMQVADEVLARSREIIESYRSASGSLPEDIVPLLEEAVCMASEQDLQPTVVALLTVLLEV